jgi:hypothetical protein
VLEGDDDRQLLWLHSNRWIFGKAICVLQNKVNSHGRRLLFLFRMRETNSRGSAFLIPDRPFTYNPPLPAPDEDPQERSVGSKQATTTEEENDIQSGSRLTAIFLAYLRQSSLPYFNEYNALAELESIFSRMFSQNAFAQGTSALYFDTVFPAWIRFRRAIVDVKSSLSQLKTEQLRPNLLKYLESVTGEFLKHRFTATDVPDISAEEVVRLGFGRMATSLAESEQVMQAIRAGLEKLNKDWFSLRTELIKEE